MGVQDRIEASLAGRIVISLAIAVTLAALFVANIPGGPYLKQKASSIIRTAELFGLGQGWGVFTHPRVEESLDLHGEIRFTDGRVETYTFPRFGRLLGVYREVHWHKWEEFAVLDSFGASQIVRRQTADWLALRFASHGDVKSVTLIGERVQSAPPGPGADPESESTEIYVRTY